MEPYGNPVYRPQNMAASLPTGTTATAPSALSPPTQVAAGPITDTVSLPGSSTPASAAEEKPKPATVKEAIKQHVLTPWHIGLVTVLGGLGAWLTHGRFKASGPAHAIPLAIAVATSIAAVLTGLKAGVATMNFSWDKKEPTTKKESVLHELFRPTAVLNNLLWTLIPSLLARKLSPGSVGIKNFLLEAAGFIGMFGLSAWEGATKFDAKQQKAASAPEQAVSAQPLA